MRRKSELNEQKKPSITNTQRLLRSSGSRVRTSDLMHTFYIMMMIIEIAENKANKRIDSEFSAAVVQRINTKK